MPAPKTPNTAAATAAVRRKKQDRMAAELRDAGWTVVPPDEADNPPTTAGKSSARLDGTKG